MTLLYGKTANGNYVPVQVDATGQIVSVITDSGGGTAGSYLRKDITAEQSVLGPVNFDGDLRLPMGPTAAQPSPGGPGYIRYNTDYSDVEVFRKGDWWVLEDLYSSTPASDIQEGSWTPIMAGQVATGATTPISFGGYIRQLGRWQRVGTVMTCFYDVEAYSVPGNVLPGGQGLVITGLPTPQGYNPNPELSAASDVLCQPFYFSGGYLPPQATIGPVSGKGPCIVFYQRENASSSQTRVLAYNLHPGGSVAMRGSVSYFWK